MFDKLRYKIRKKRKIEKALELASQPIWYIYYFYGVSKKEVGVYRMQTSKKEEAIHMASIYLDSKYDGNYKIVTISCI